MVRHGMWGKRLAWLVLLAGLATALLFWFENLGSEQPLQMKEIPVQPPAEKAGSHN
jgi:hypothetical protein